MRFSLLFFTIGSKKAIAQKERAAAERVKVENPPPPELERLGFPLRFLPSYGKPLQYP